MSSLLGSLVVLTLCSNNQFPCLSLSLDYILLEDSLSYSQDGCSTNACGQALAVYRLILSCYVCTRTMGRNDFLILLTQGRWDILNMNFTTGSHPSKETMRQDGVTPSKGFRCSITWGKAKRWECSARKRGGLAKITRTVFQCLGEWQSGSSSSGGVGGERLL